MTSQSDGEQDGFGEREHRARGAWASYSNDATKPMSHDFRAGYHRGVIDQSRRATEDRTKDSVMTAVENQPERTNYEIMELIQKARYQADHRTLLPWTVHNLADELMRRLAGGLLQRDIRIKTGDVIKVVNLKSKHAGMMGEVRESKSRVGTLTETNRDMYYVEFNDVHGESIDGSLFYEEELDWVYTPTRTTDYTPPAFANDEYMGRIRVQDNSRTLGTWSV